MAQFEGERVSFDEWLLSTGRSGEKVLMHFFVPPRNNDRGTDDVSVLKISKEFVLLEYSDGECFWTQKDLIMAVGFSS